MQFGSNPVSEIVVPSDVPFEPGNNVIGIGAGIPPELIAAGYVNAIVWYFANWNPASTTPLPKFAFIAANAITGNATAAMHFGFGLCDNPSANPTAVVQSLFVISAEQNFTGRMDYQSIFFNALGNQIINILEWDSTGDGEFVVLNNADSHTAYQRVISTGGTASWQLT
jgi:hypothetical protein